MYVHFFTSYLVCLRYVGHMIREPYDIRDANLRHTHLAKSSSISQAFSWPLRYRKPRVVVVDRVRVAIALNPAIHIPPVGRMIA